jgi:hypothetical protein
MSATTKPDLTAAMAQLRHIALTSADNALTEGPVNADRLLLDLCADALHALVHAERSLRTCQEAPRTVSHAVRSGHYEDYQHGTTTAKPPLARIKKIKATTAAGIYAKAAIVRASRTGAADLAISLAQDLLDCPGLRAALWPAGEVA